MKIKVKSAWLDKDGIHKKGDVLDIDVKDFDHLRMIELEEPKTEEEGETESPDETEDPKEEPEEEPEEVTKETKDETKDETKPKTTKTSKK